MTFVHRSYEELIHSLTKAEFRFVLENEPNLADPLVDLVQQMVAQLNKNEGRVSAAVLTIVRSSQFRSIRGRDHAAHE